MPPETKEKIQAYFTVTQKFLQIVPPMLQYTKQISGTVKEFLSKLKCLPVTQVIEGYTQRDTHMQIQKQINLHRLENEVEEYQKM